MAQPFVTKPYFDGVGADKQLKFDPTGFTLPTFTIGLVYALDASGDVILATALSDLVLGIYTGDNDVGFPIFEQLFFVSTAAFAPRGTRWYLTGAGVLTSTPNDALFGIAVDDDTLLITWNGLDTGGIVAGEPNTNSNQGAGAGLALAKNVFDLPLRTLISPDASVTIAENGDVIDLTVPAPGLAADENSVEIVAVADTFDFVSDVAGGKPFADVVDNDPIATIEIDKQLNFNALAASVGPVVTGFSFLQATYRACEIFYVIESTSGARETGSIYITHDGASAVIRVDPLAIGGASNVIFTADISGADCRLLYTESGGDIFSLRVKPRVMVV